jgi:DNA-binding transcriptional regulator YdaS (Cro superfamily)
LSTDASTRLSRLPAWQRKLLAAKLANKAKRATRGQITGEDLRDALFHRVEGYLRESISHLDERGLLEAVEAPTPGDTIARVMAAASEVELERDPWTEALLRGASIKQEAIRLGGGLLSSGEVARLLGVSVAAVKQRQRRGNLLALPLANGEWGYPARQFAETGKVHDGLPRVLAAFADASPWVVLSFLVNPVPGSDEGIAFDALSDPESVDRVTEVARTYGEQGAA